VAGTLGITVQVSAFVIILLISTRRHRVSRGLVYGGIVAVYGYALVVSFFSLLAVPWQATNFFLAGALTISLAFGATRRAIAEGLGPLYLAVRTSWAAISIFASIVALHLLVAAMESELSIDGQLYHGPTLANIVQSGSLWGWSAPNQYLYYTDLTMAGGVNLATFTGPTQFDNAIQIPHLLLLIFIINWALSHRFTSSFLRVSLAALIASAPVIWLQPRILYVDLAYGVAVAASIFFVVFVREFRRFDVVVAGILVGAVFATKPAGILTGLILLSVLALVVFLRRRAMSRWRSTFVVMVVGIGLPLLMAMSFYIRNMIQFGNPVYPIQAKFGPILLPGILDLSVFTSGERGNGLIDPGRLISYAGSIGSGMLHGVTKLDYDPRVGGFGLVPLFVLALTLALIGVQIVLRMRARTASRGTSWLQHGKAQCAIVALAGIILLVQPSTFDARYVVGPTVVLLTAALLTSAIALPTVLQLLAGGIALSIALGQVVWTERTMYPGIKVAIDLIQGPAIWQPNTPGNPRGHGLQVAWLPDNPERCVSIALQTSGGLTPVGMAERSFLATLSYGLYGAEFCNRVLPITLNRDGSGDPAQDTAAVIGADYLVLYAGDVPAWEKDFPALARCLSEVDSIEGTDQYPQAVVVFHSACG
jgi:hypothetical protein